MSVRTVNAQAAANVQKQPKSMLWSIMAILNQQAADAVALRAAIVGITAQLDGEDVTNLDTDYAANNDPAALTSDTLTTRELGLPT